MSDTFYDKNKAMLKRGEVDMMSAMGRNRAERRRLAKVNSLPKIQGSTKPYVKDKKE